MLFEVGRVSPRHEYCYVQKSREHILLALRPAQERSDVLEHIEETGDPSLAVEAGTQLQLTGKTVAPGEFMRFVYVLGME